MGWRSVLGFIILALVAGAAGFAYLSSPGVMPWSVNEMGELPPGSGAAPVAPALAAPAFATPVIVQPGASQAEGQYLVLKVRRAIEAGKPLGDLGTSLQLRFGQSQPQALVTIRDGVKQPISNAQLLKAFDAISEELERPVGTAWDIMRLELSNLFVIRPGDAEPSAAQKRTEQIRTSIIAGDIAAAAAQVRKMPGAVKAGDWLVAANRAIAVHQALDLLAQSVAISPPGPAAASAPAIVPDPAPAPLTVPMTDNPAMPVP